MVDLTTFANNPDSERFEKSMQSTRTAGVKNLYLSDKGIPKQVYNETPNPERFVSQNNNTQSSVYKTYGGSQPAVSFMGRWASNSSHVLTYFELDNQDWL